MHPEIVLHDRLPTLDEHRDLCKAVGWAPVIDFGAAPASLARTLVGGITATGTAPFNERHGFIEHEALSGMSQAARP